MKTLKVILFILLSATECFAQQYNFTGYSIDKGLPQSEVNSVIQDNKGVIWVGTNGGGICKFNGKNFSKVFSTKNGLLDNQIGCLFQDSKGRLIVASYFGISIIDGNQCIKTFGSNYFYSNLINTSFYEDNNGRIWIVFLQNSQPGQIWLLENNVLTNFTDTRPDIFANNIILFFTKGNNRFYISTLKGIYEIKNKKISTCEFTSHPEFKDKVSILFFEDKHGKKYMFNTKPTEINTHLFIYDDKYNKKSIPVSSIITNTGIFKVFMDSQDNLWIVSQMVVQKMLPDFSTILFSNKNGLPSSPITSIIEDKEGNIWLGTRGSGLIKHDQGRFVTYTLRDGLPGEVIRSIYQDTKGNFWFGTSNDGIAKFDGKKIQNFLVKDGNVIGRVNDFIEQSDGKLLICSQFGLYEFSGNTLSKINNDYGVNGSPFIIHCIPDEKSFWFALYGGGVAKYSEKGTVIYNQQNSKVVSNFVRYLLKDSNGNIWIATEGGVSQWNGQKFSSYTIRDGLAHPIVLQMVEDKFRRIWFATFGGGISIYDSKKGFQTINENQGLSSNIVYSLVNENSNTIWAGMQKGVDKIIINEKGEISKIKFYGKNEGFTGDENNGKAIFKDKSGNLWFGTLKGAVCLNPKVDRENHNPPATNILNIRLFFKDVNWKDQEYATFSDSIDKSTNLPANLVLPYHLNHITFDFEALCYSGPEKVSYQWKLEGNDKEWNPVTDKTEAVYTNLPEGNYTFYVKACNNEGVWSTNPTAFKFTVKPPFWNQWWFRILAVLSIGSLIYGLVLLRIKKLEAKKKELERLIAEKTHEVRLQNEQILLKNEVLQKQKEEILTQTENLMKYNEEILTKNEDIERKNREITSSIHYAKRIQSAMLPDDEKIKEYLPELFIYYQPKDIVSGDFYWFTEKDNKIIIAAVDCTGHGVPGAFMSLIGDAYLNQIINLQGITKPDEILNNLNICIYHALKQEFSHVNDGMDIALCTIDKENNTVEYAGAYNPLVYIQNNELKILKGDKILIGGQEITSEITYKCHKIKIEEPTTFYIFSDGYEDQFGGVDGRKFLTRRFINLLFSIHSHSMEEQREKLMENMKNWMGNEKQIDDILVMGWRLQ